MWISTGFARIVEGSSGVNAIKKMTGKRLEARLSRSDYEGAFMCSGELLEDCMCFA